MAVADWLKRLTGANNVPPKNWTPRLEFGVASLVGIREHNEDSFYAPGWPAVSRNAPTLARDSMHRPLDGPNDLILVADGMGGQLAGEVASQMAAELIPATLDELISPDKTDPKIVQQAITLAIQRANREILRESEQQGGRCARMGTTVVLALFRGKSAYIAHLGDSRAFRLRGSRLERLTKDHTMAQALCDAGAIGEDQLAGHKYQSVLYLHLGTPDADQGPETIRELELSPGDRFLLASDGLTGVLNETAIAQILIQNADPQKAAVALVDSAFHNFSRDNITGIVVNVR